MKKRIIIVLLVLLGIYIILYFANNGYYVDNDIPIININLKDTDINYINKHSKDKKYFGNNMLIIDNGKKEKYEDVMIKGRGNFTWNLKKKPYQIAFDDKTSILGLPEGKKFILLANATDSSLLKNDFSYSVAKNMKLNYSFTGKFVDLYIDDNYIGNYYVTPKVAINKSVVDLKDDKAIIMELDNSYYKAEKEEDVAISNTFNDHIVLKDSESESAYEDMKVFMNKYNTMEEAIRNRDYNELEKIIDIDSFAKYYIISEFAENSDALISSLFFYMDGYEDKIHIGPIWDCDIGYGLRPQYANTKFFPIRENNFAGEERASALFYELLQIDEFNDKVIDIWNSVGRDVYKKEITNLNKKIKYLYKSGTYNNEFWHKTEYKATSKVLVDWINSRYKYFNSYMEGYNENN